MDQELERKLSAIRLGEMLEPYASRAPSTSSYYPNYQAVPRKATETHFDCGTKTENLYANLQELRQSHYYEACSPKSPLTSVTCTQSASQTKMSLQEAMRYTPPDMLPQASHEPPVYENIQYYSPQVNKPPSSMPTNHDHHQLYRPAVPSSLASSTKSQAQLNSSHSTEQFSVPTPTRLQQTYVNINTTPSPYKPVPSLQKTYEISYLQNSTKENIGYLTAPSITANYVSQLTANPSKLNPQVSSPNSTPKFNTQSSSHQTKVNLTPSPLSNKSPMPYQQLNVSPSTSQFTPGSSSPKVPLATVPAKKVMIMIAKLKVLG